MREIRDFSRVLREAAWFVGCLVAAISFAKLTEDKGNQTPVVTIIFYLVSGGVRFLVWKVMHR